MDRKRAKHWDDMTLTEREAVYTKLANNTCGPDREAFEAAIRQLFTYGEERQLNGEVG